MTNSEYTHIGLVVDRSGSMHGIHTDMNGAILTLLGEQAKEPGYCVVDVVTFDTEIEHPIVGVRPEDVKGDIIHPRGGTALLDAIGYTVTRLGERFAKMREEKRPANVIIVVVTDGGENSSKEYNREQVKALIEMQESQYNWTFMYLAANVDAFATGGAMGFSNAHSSGYTANSVGVENSYLAASANITRVRNGDTRGFTEEEREAASV